MAKGSVVKILSVVTVPLPDAPLDPFFVTYAARLEMMKKERTRLEALVNARPVSCGKGQSTSLST